MMAARKKTVHVVHCVDAEGPLYESLEATFERIREVFGVELEATPENLQKLQGRELALGKHEEAIQKLVDPQLLSYHDTWEKIDRMLYELLEERFRRTLVDSWGQGWIFNWFCLDHVGFTQNPRRRDLGYHKVFDHYRNVLEETQSNADGLQFHYHPVPFSRSANHCATHYFARSDTLFQVLGRRIIDRQWFPGAYRPGFHTIRPDSHWFLEQFIPFDFSNQSHEEDGDQPDLIAGRFGDWRRATRSWTPYHPHHDDYQSEGSCRRLTARCLNMRTRMRCLNQGEVDRAFAEAQDGSPVVLSFTNHDFRNMRPEMESVYHLLKSASERFPDVGFKFCEAREAIRSAMDLKRRPPVRFRTALEGNRLTIEAETPIFGPQPFFAIRTRTGKYYHDNLDFQQSFQRWSYVFDGQTILMDDVSKIGLAANDSVGQTTVAIIDVEGGFRTQMVHL
jgi:hypothetical protein